MPLGASQRKTMLEETTAHAGHWPSLQTEGRSVTNLDRVPTGPQALARLLVTIDSTPVALEVKRYVDEPAARAEKGVERLEDALKELLDPVAKQMRCKLVLDLTFDVQLLQKYSRQAAARDADLLAPSHPRGGSARHRGSSADRVYGPLGPAAGRCTRCTPLRIRRSTWHHGRRPDGPSRGRRLGRMGDRNQRPSTCRPTPRRQILAILSQWDESTELTAAFAGLRTDDPLVARLQRLEWRKRACRVRSSTDRSDPECPIAGLRASSLAGKRWYGGRAEC